MESARAYSEQANQSADDAQTAAEAAQASDKINKQQGVGNVGLGLVVGDDGIVGLGDIGISEDAKLALLNCFDHVAWTDEHGSEYYQALYNALYGAGSVETWDYQWSYLDGLPEDNGMVFESGSGGTTNHVINNEGLYVTTGDNTSSISRFKYYPQELPYTSGVYELMFRVNAFGEYNVAPYGNGIKLNCGFGQRNGAYLKGAELTFNRSGILILTQGTSSSTNRAIFATPFDIDSLYKIRVEQNANGANIFLNGRFITNVPTSDFYENVGPVQFIVSRGAAATFKFFRVRFSE